MTPTRREMLRNACALSAAPLLPLLESTAARAAAPPRRLLVFYTPNGTIGPEWWPKGSETDFTFGRILQPLDAWKPKLIVLGGIHMPLAESGYGSHHTRGIGGFLTGRPILMGNFKSAGPPTAGWASGISIDQHIARTVGSATPFRSLELGVRVIDAEVRGRISYLGPNQPLPPAESPYDAFDRLFAGMNPTAGGDAALERLRLERRSVLDFVQEELGAVRARLPASDRTKVDSHLDAIRDIERRLEKPATTGTMACPLPTVGNRIDVQATDSFPTVGRLQMDLLAAAFACDLTRVATLMWTHAEADQTFPWIGVQSPHHSTSHAVDGDTDAQEMLIKINNWYAQQFKYLLDKLASYGEGGGTLLDNTVVLWGIEVGKGNNHDHRNLPWLLAGSCGGALRTGRYVDYGANGAAGRRHNDLLVSLAQAMGLGDTTFGDPQFSTGPLPGLS